MSRDPIVVGPSYPVEDVARLMGQHGIRRIPVVKDGKPVGMHSADDIARFYTDDTVILEMERRIAAYIGAPLPTT
jgi:predicted transcriptional regulator